MNYEQEIDKWLRKLENHILVDHPDPDMTQRCLYVDDIKQQLMELLNKARVDELEYVRGFGERGGADVYRRTIGDAVLKRLEQLNTKGEYGKDN